jgi:membrane fusion protein (multidrug efflux system)
MTQQREIDNDPRTTAQPRAVEPVAVEPSRKMNGKRPFVILGAVIAALVVVIGIYAVVTRNMENTDDAQVEADVAPISALVGGTALRIPVADNQRVKKGDVLVEIDPADYLAKVKQYEGAVEAAEAQAQAAESQEEIVEASSRGGYNAAKAMLSGSNMSVAAANAQVAAAGAAVAKARAELRRAEDDFKREVALLKEGSAAQADYDRAQANYDAARATEAQSEAQLTAAEQLKHGAESRVAEAQGRVEQSEPVNAQVAAARAAADLARARLKEQQGLLEGARLQLGRTRVVAPFDGTLSKLAVREGQLVQANMMVVELAPVTTYVIANFKETQTGRMKPGQRANITVDAFPGRHFKGRVESLSPATGARFSLMPPDNASGNFVKVVQRVPVKIVWENLPAGVAPEAGLSADVTVYVK